MQQHANFIAGTWTPPEAGDFYEIHNPAHPETVLGRFPKSVKADAEAALDEIGRAHV